MAVSKAIAGEAAAAVAAATGVATSADGAGATTAPAAKALLPLLRAGGVMAVAMEGEGAPCAVAGGTIAAWKGVSVIVPAEGGAALPVSGGCGFAAAEGVSATPAATDAAALPATGGGALPARGHSSVGVTADGMGMASVSPDCLLAIG
jgi:hypothetical protein